jgi:hypothetical protein
VARLTPRSPQIVDVPGFEHRTQGDAVQGRARPDRNESLLPR